MCSLFLLVFHTLEFVFHDVYDYVRDHEDVTGQIRRGRLFLYLQEDPGLGSYQSSPASTEALVVDGSEVHDAGKFVRVKFSANDVQGSEESPCLVIHITFHKPFAVYVIGVSLHGDVDFRQMREGEVFAVFRATFREQQDGGLHALPRSVHVDDLSRGVLLPAQGFQQGRVVITQRPSDVVLVFDLSHEVFALYDLVLQVEVRKFVFALVLTVLGLKDLLGLREDYPILEVKHTVTRVRTVVTEDLAKGYFHPVAYVGDG